MSASAQVSRKTFNQRMSWFIGTLRQRRRDLDMVQADVDQSLGVADGLCAKWECGNRFPSAYNLHCWCDLLGLSWLLVPAAEKERNDPGRRRRR